MQKLDVVNRCIATLGQAPISSLEEQHAFKAAALSRLDTEDAKIQAVGWWFNREALTLSPTVEGKIVLPNDTVSVRTPYRKYAQRGLYLFDLDGGTNIFTSDVDVVLIRRLAFEDLPQSAAEYVAACTVFLFQSDIDGDSNRSRVLADDRSSSRISMNTEEIRNSRSNFLDSNVRLQRLKGYYRGFRRFVN